MQSNILTCALGLWAWSFPSLDAISTSPEWFIPLATFTTNIAITLNMQHFGVLGAYWTLAPEEQFYLFGGISLKQFSPSQLRRLCIIVLAACYIWRFFPPPFSIFLHYRIQLPVSLASIVLGCLLALMPSKIHSHLNKSKSTLSIMAILGLFLLSYFEWPFPKTALGCCILISCADIVALILVILAIGKGGLINKFLSFQPFVYIGKISLCMYAINLPVIYFYYKYKNSIFSLIPIDFIAHPIYAICTDITIIYLLIIMISSAWQLIDNPITRLRHLYRSPVLIEEPPSIEREHSPIKDLENTQEALVS